MEFIRELNFYYIQSRYPEERNKIGKGVTKRLAGNTLRQTEELFKWLDSMLM